MSHADGKTAKLFKKAVTKHKAGQFRDAEALYKKILKDDGGHLDANYLLGALYAERGDLERALKFTLCAADLAPHSPFVQNNLGNIYRLRGDLGRAEQHYRRALYLKPDLAEAYNNLGNVLKRLGCGEEALTCYRHAIDRNPLLIEAHYNLGKLYGDSDHRDEAAACYRRVLELSPHHAPAHDGLGTYYLSQGDREQALVHFQKYLALVPGDDAGVRLKLAYLHAGETPAQYPADLIRQTYEYKAATWDSDAARPAMEFLGPAHVRAAFEKAASGRSGLDILDLGCGTGACGVFLRSFARQLTGVDLSPPMLRIAADKRLYDRLETADIVAYANGHSGEYDAITASGVLIFMNDLGPVLAAAARALRADGFFVCTLYRSEADDVAVRKNFHFAHSAGHVRERAAQAGLRVEVLDEIVHEYDYGQAQAGWIAVLRRD